MLSFRSCFLDGEGLAVSEILRGSSEWKVPTSEDVSQILTIPTAIGGVAVHGNSEGTGEWGHSLSLCCSVHGGTTAIVARILKELRGRLVKIVHPRGKNLDFVCHNQKEWWGRWSWTQSSFLGFRRGNGQDCDDFSRRCSRQFRGSYYVGCCSSVGCPQPTIVPRIKTSESLEV